MRTTRVTTKHFTVMKTNRKRTPKEATSKLDTGASRTLTVSRSAVPRWAPACTTKSARGPTTLTLSNRQRKSEHIQRGSHCQQRLGSEKLNLMRRRSFVRLMSITLNITPRMRLRVRMEALGTIISCSDYFSHGLSNASKKLCSPVYF